MAKNPRHKPTRDNLASRVQGLIDRYHAGSVNAAAMAIGVPQRSLARIATGAVSSPRVGILESVARYFGVTLDWLTAGGDDAPPLELPIEAEADAEWLQWRRLIVDLALPDAVRDAMWHLPLSTSWAWRDLCQGRSLDGTELKLLQEVSGAEIAAWLTLFRGLIRLYGIERVRQALIAHPDWIRLGFNRLAMELRDQGKIRGDLEAPFQAANLGAWSRESPRRGERLS